MRLSDPLAPPILGEDRHPSNRGATGPVDQRCGYHIHPVARDRLTMPRSNKLGTTGVPTHQQKHRPSGGVMFHLSIISVPSASP